MVVQVLAILPIPTAALAVACALQPGARRFVRQPVALAAVDVILTPLISGGGVALAVPTNRANGNNLAELLAAPPMCGTLGA